MDFDLKDEHRMMRDMARTFADETIAPRAEEMDAKGEFP
jgi:short-chain 2-methylacyl-CoA dehydrogenase